MTVTGQSGPVATGLKRPEADIKEPAYAGFHWSLDCCNRRARCWALLKRDA